MIVVAGMVVIALEFRGCEYLDVKRGSTRLEEVPRVFARCAP